MTNDKPKVAPLIWDNTSNYPLLKFEARFIIWYKKNWDSEKIRDLKSNNMNGITKNVKYEFMKVLNYRICNLNFKNIIPIIILPPRKNGKPQSMEFIINLLKGKYDIAIIYSNDYKKLHNANNAKEREQIIKSASNTWVLNFKHSRKNRHFIFVDDIFTRGSTTRSVFHKLKNDWFKESQFKNEGYSNNFQGVYLCRTYSKSNEEWTSICSPKLSEEINNSDNDWDLDL